jgi:TolB-like protein
LSFLKELKRRNVFRVAIAYGVAAWLLLQITDVLVPILNLSDSAARLVFLLLVIGFVPALIFAWAFEMTPDGIKKESEIERGESITPNTGKKLDRVIIAGLVLIIVGMAAERFWFAGSTEQPTEMVSAVEEAGEAAGPAGLSQQSVAVLPFASMSSGEDDEYFADGLTEEILNSLAALPELLVTARTSSFHFKGQNLPVQQIAETLGVAHIVEGSVRRAGEQVRITAQLIRANDGFHLWSDTYDRTLEDVFAVQEEIAENIARTLDVVLDEDKRNAMRQSGIRDVEAFIAYQKGLEGFGNAHVNVGGITEKLEANNQYFETALASAPSLVSARILLADTAGHHVFDLATGVRGEAWPGEAQEKLDGLRGEYDLAWTSAPMGNQRDILEVERSLFADNWNGLRNKIERAMLPAESCPTTNWTLEAANSFGLTDTAIEKIREKLRCDPYDYITHFHLIHMLIWVGEHDAAFQAGEDALSRGLGFEWVEEAMMYSLLAKGELDDARLMQEETGASFLKFPRKLLTLARAGDIPQAIALAEEFWASETADDWASAHVAAVIGDRDKANELAGRIDSKPGGSLVLSNLTHICSCGAPFDIEATPNFKRNIEEAGFDWPPPKAIDFPAKDW